MSSPRPLPPRASLEHLRNEAKQRLKALRAQDPSLKLTDAQLTIAREYGFASWRRLKAAVDAQDRERVFAAARAGDVEAIRRVLRDGFNPGETDDAGRTIHQIAKTLDHTELELFMRVHQERDERHDDVKRAVRAIQEAAAEGRADELERLLDAHPDLIDASSVSWERQTALHKAAWRNRLDCVRILLEHGANVGIRDFGDNAYPLHFAAAEADFAIVRMLVEAGSDVVGEGDDHHLEVLGWATCLGRVREDVAEYLLRAGARLNIWSAIALDRTDDVRAFVRSVPARLSARMSRNEHGRTPLHHAAAMNRPAMVRLLLALGADVHARDDVGRTALTVAAAEKANPEIHRLLQEAGAELDLLTAITLGRYDLAEQILAEDPARIGPDGRDTIALHLLVVQRNTDGVRWLIEHGVAVNAKRVMWDCNHTALHVTTELPGGAIDLARMLLDAGADPNIRDGKYEATALGWAEFCGQPQIAELLRQRGGI
jgi:ankyrin repeat protein